MTITPDQARELLDVATPGPWREDGSNIMNHDGDPLLSDWSFGDPNWYNDRDITLMAAAPELAQTIAGMTEEWGVEADSNALFPVNEEWHPNGEYFTESRADAEAVRDRMAKLNPHTRYRLVRRLVGPVEVAE